MTVVRTPLSARHALVCLARLRIAKGALWSVRGSWVSRRFVFLLDCPLFPCDYVAALPHPHPTLPTVLGACLSVRPCACMCGCSTIAGLSTNSGGAKPFPACLLKFYWIGDSVLP